MNPPHLPTKARLLSAWNHPAPQGQPTTHAKTDGAAAMPMQERPLRQLAGAPRRPRLLMAQPEAPHKAPLLCFDRNDLTGWRLRSTREFSELQPTVNVRGLRELRLSGSASFSSEAQVWDLSRLWQGSFHVIDLRQEPHAIVEGVPVTWVADQNWANMGKSREEALAHEQSLIDKFRHERDACTLQSCEDIEKGRPPATMTLSGASAKDEASLVKDAGGGYTRLMVSDHLRPRDEDVDLFIDTVRQLAPGTGLHVHCKGGMGRTVTHMAMYDMLHNAGAVSAEDILARQAALEGGYDLAKPRDNPAIKAFHEERLAFLNEFHAFAKANPKGRPQNWSEWLGRPAVQAELVEVPPRAPRRNSVA